VWKAINQKSGSICKSCYNSNYAKRTPPPAVNQSTKPLKEWNELGHSQKNVRKRKSLEYLGENKMPLEHLKKRKVTRVTHLSKTMRNSIRAVAPIIQCERTVCGDKVKLSISHGTATRSFFF
jgi:hypothetical protein